MLLTEVAGDVKATRVMVAAGKEETQHLRDRVANIESRAEDTKTNHEKRIQSLERMRAYATGALAIVTAAAAFTVNHILNLIHQP